MREVQKSYGAPPIPKSVVSRPTPEQRSPLHVTAAFNRHDSQQTSMLPRKPEQEAMLIQFSASEPKDSQSGTHELTSIQKRCTTQLLANARSAREERITQHENETEYKREQYFTSAEPWKGAMAQTALQSMRM